MQSLCRFGLTLILLVELHTTLADKGGSSKASVFSNTTGIQIEPICPHGDFTCLSGSVKCVIQNQVCDGFANCEDRSDEHHCHSCNADGDWFYCGNNKTDCIAAHWRCDQEIDCDDGSDEQNCTIQSNLEENTCKQGEFRCKNGLCIPNIWFCDGHHDCLDQDDEDEEMCRSSVKSNGKHYQNMQTNETYSSLNDNGGTVGVSYLGLITHESKICGEKSFKCSSSDNCVPERWVCDGTPDCPDRSDEHMCPHTHYSCLNLTVQGQETYLCADGFTCIPLTSICDGIDHCPDGSDEGPTCDTSCLNANCELSCMPSPVNDRGTCFCTGDYTLGEDGKSCIDINECDIFGSCSQDCENIQGSYACSCKPGYEMVRSSCKAMGEDSALLLFSSRSEIRGMYLPSERPFNISQKRVNQAVGVAYDRLTDRVYWSDLQPQHEAIVSSRMDGTDIRWFLEGGKIAMAESMVVDYVARNLYYTDSIKKVVGVCAIDNPSNLTKDAMNGESNTKRMCTNILTNIDQPRGLGLYPPEGLLFYSNWGNNPHIGRAGMDGTRPEAIISKDIGWPNGIAVDIVLKRIYWSDAKHGRIETALFDGSDRRTVFFQSVQHPFSLAVFEDTLYWSDWDTQQVQSCNKFNGGDHKVLVQEPKLHGIHIYHPLLEVNHTNPCTNAKCSHLCLLAYGGNGYTCSCPSPTKWHLAEDRVTCHRHFEADTTMSREYAYSYAIYGPDVNDSRAIDKADLETAREKETTPGEIEARSFQTPELIAENSTIVPLLANSGPPKTFLDWPYEAQLGLGIAIILMLIIILLLIFIACKCGFIPLSSCCCEACVWKRPDLMPVGIRFKNPAFGLDSNSSSPSRSSACSSRSSDLDRIAPRTLSSASDSKLKQSRSINKHPWRTSQDHTKVTVGNMLSTDNLETWNNMNFGEVQSNPELGSDTYKDDDRKYDNTDVIDSNKGRFKLFSKDDKKLSLPLWQKDYTRMK